MNKGTAFALGLILGGGAGGFIAFTILKQKFAQKSDEEIAACREAFLAELAKRRKETEEKDRQEKKEKAEEAIKSYSPEPEKAAKTLSTAASSSRLRRESRKTLRM